MTKEELNPFVAGADVYMMRLKINSNEVLVKADKKEIKKVYENGNFILRNDEKHQQWKPCFESFRSNMKWRAYKNGISRDFIIPCTENERVI